MGTTTTDKTTNQYNQQGTNAYNQMTPAMGQAATGYISNPFGNPFFQQQQQMGTNQANNLGQTGMSQLLQNQAASGFGGSSQSPYMQQLMSQQARGNSNPKAQLGFQQPVNNALQLQQNSMGLAAGYKPLQTGQTTTQSTGGLGTWLPQVAGAALGGLTGFATGGASGLMKGLGMGGGGGQQGGGGMPGGAANGMAGIGDYGGFGQSPQMPSPIMGGGMAPWMNGGGGGYQQPGMTGGGMTPWLQ